MDIVIFKSNFRQSLSLILLSPEKKLVPKKSFKVGLETGICSDPETECSRFYLNISMLTVPLMPDSSLGPQCPLQQKKRFYKLQSLYAASKASVSKCIIKQNIYPEILRNSYW